MKFIIAIEPGTKRSAHGVAVPDLPGCFSAGDSIEEAFDNAAQAIELHCELLAEGGGDLPTLKTMTEHQGQSRIQGLGLGRGRCPDRALLWAGREGQHHGTGSRASAH